jgi:hypothetical protein
MDASHTYAQQGRDAIHNLQAAVDAWPHDPAGARTLLAAAVDKLHWVELATKPRRSPRGGPPGARVYRTGLAYRRAIRKKILKPARDSGWLLTELPQTFFAQKLGIAYRTYLTYNDRYGVTPEAIRAGTV